MNRLGRFARRVHRYKPLAAAFADREVFNLAQYFAAVAVAKPAEFWQKYAVVALVEPDLFGVGITEARRAFALFPEAGKGRAFRKKVAVGALQVLEGLLQGMYGRIRKPCGLRFTAPCRELLAQPGVAEFLLPAFAAFLLQGERFVENEAARTREAAHPVCLFAVGP